jgi:hypothetical protein
MNIKITDIEQKTDIIYDRIDKLRSSGYYLEAFYFFANILEVTLRDAVMCQRDYLSEYLKLDGFCLNNDGQKKIEEMTLGELITQFKKYYKIDSQKLVSRLENINGFRIKTVHNITKHDLVLLNKESDTLYTNNRDLILKLLQYCLWCIEKRHKLESNKT